MKIHKFTHAKLRRLELSTKQNRNENFRVFVHDSCARQSTPDKYNREREFDPI